MDQKINDFVDKIFSLSREGSISEAEEMFENFENFRHILKEPLFTGMSSLVKSLFSFYFGDNVKSTEYSKKALEVFDTNVSESDDDISYYSMKSRNILASSLNNLGKRDESLYHYELNLKKLEKSNHLLDLAICYNNIGYNYLIKGHYKKARNYLLLALNEIEILIDEDPSQSLLFLKRVIRENIALILINRGEYGNAKEILLEMLKDNMLENDPLNESKIYHDLGVIALEQGNYTDAKASLDKALDIATEANYFIRIAMISGDLGEYYIRQGKLDLAEEKLHESIRICEKSNNQEDIVKRYCQTFEIQDMRNYSKNEMNLDQLNLAVNLAKKHESDEELILTGYYLGKFYFRHELYDLASLVLESTYIEAKKTNYDRITLNCQLYLSAINIAKYLEDRSNVTLLNKAQNFLSKLILIAKEKELCSIEIRGLYLTAIINLALFDVEIAYINARDANILAHQTENHIFSKKITNFLDNLTVLRKIDDIVQSERLHILYSYQSTITFLSEISYGELNRKEKTENLQFSTFFVHQTEVGPKIYYKDENCLNYVSEKELLISAVTLTMAIGQGESYHQGFYGPFPVNANTYGLVYSTVLIDPDTADERIKEKNFCLYVILLNYNSNLTNNDQENMHKILQKKFYQINNLNQLSKDWFENLSVSIRKNDRN